MNVQFPPFIALVGHPGAGKDAVQDFLHDLFGVLAVDDGRPLRDAAKNIYQLTEWQVTTAEGKRETVDVLGQTWSVRQLLGELGNRLEEQHGRFIMPWAAIQSVLRDVGGVSNMAVPRSFSSVRRDQGREYQRHGGIVVEVFGPNVPEPEHEFDRYDPECVDHRIVNDGTLEDLRRKTYDVFLPILWRDTA